MHRPGRTSAPSRQQHRKSAPGTTAAGRTPSAPSRRDTPFKKGHRNRHRSTPTSDVESASPDTLRGARPLPARIEARPRRPFSVGAFRHFLRSLPPTATVDLADEPPIVVMDNARMRATCVMFARGPTVVGRLLARLGIPGPFDNLPAVPVRASAPLVGGACAPEMGVRLCHPKRERVAHWDAARPVPTIYELCCETILDRARTAYRESGALGAVGAVADVSSVLASAAPVDVALYACGATLVTHDVALGALALGESQSDVDAAYACTARTVTPHGSVGIYERRPR
ncbi:hypothetical protein psal_cds_1227 [Pandoravirus salinus]|uniref:Uncharacterized protein n=1 Tax=Pandoravirus salinus TaxID=1349410 RepID=S4VYX0_9VIRU|nr:KAR9 superfamily incomplete domain [Pandoravirus salinus]AGO85543.1 hypothetical protein psal_cds_1227 [Pandoravirus salinus]